MDLNAVKDLDPASPNYVDQLRTYHQFLVTKAKEVSDLENHLQESHQILERDKAELQQRGQQLQAQNRPSLDGVLDKLASQIGLQNVDENVKSYGGNPKELTRWLKAIEKHVHMVFDRLDSQECIRVAYRTSRNTVSDFLGRYLKDAVDPTWDAVKAELTARFGEKLDAQSKLLKLRHYKQRAEQGEQVFAEVILGKAGEIFNEEDLSHWFIQKELVTIFATGLRSKAVGKKVLAKNPATMSGAVAAANEATERDLRLRAHGMGPERHEEAMDVSMVRQSDRGKYTSDRGKYTGKSTPNPSRPTTPPNKGRKNEWKDGRPVCNYCGRPNHMYKDCLKRKTDQRSATSRKSLN